MRVAYVCADPGVPAFGHKGCSIHVQEMLRAMLRRGWEVDLLARRFGGSPPADLSNVRIIRLGKPAKTADTAGRERELIALNRPLRIELECQGEYELVYERYALWSTAALHYAADAGVPSILEVNSPLLEEQATHRRLHDQPTARAMTEQAFASAHSIAAVSRGVARHVDSFQVSQSPPLIQPNGVNPEHFSGARTAIAQRQQQRRWRSSSESFVIGFSGTLRPWHGMQVLGKAFRQLRETYPQVKLLVVGDGPSRDELLAEVGPCHADVTITGKVAHHLVPEFLARMDVAVAPYPQLENFYFSPLKVFEYMACGLPVIASRIGDIPDYLEDRQSGRLVAAGNATEFSAAISEIVEQPEFGLLLGRRAVHVVQSHHTWDRALENILRHADITREESVRAEAVTRSAV